MTRDTTYLRNLLLCGLFFFQLAFSIRLDAQPFIESKEYTSSVNTSYRLVEGKIERFSRSQNEWITLLESGLPMKSTNMPGEKEGKNYVDRILEIDADADFLFALGSDRYLYLYIEPQNRWYDKIGAPLTGRIKLPECRDWALMRSVHHTVPYLEDIDGNKRYVGKEGITNLYCLSPDGSEIFYADTGLPPDFSSHIETPFRNRFIAQSIAATGSTIFLIGRNGVMYTRLADYDTLGNNPMFYDYSYKRKVYGHEPTRENMYAPISLPAEPWLRQKDIELDGKASITTQISIVLSGKEIQNRELRVAGRNMQGESGYYYKEIYEKSWHFKKASIDFDESTVVIESSSYEPELAPSKDMAYQGTLSRHGEEDLRVELVDYNLHATPTRMIASNNETSVNILLHTVDMYSFVTQHDPGRDGTLKRSFVTVEIPESELNSADLNKKRLLDTYFKDLHLKSFALDLLADTRKLYMFEKAQGGLKLRVTRSEDEDVVFIHPYLSAAQASALQIEDQELFEFRSIEEKEAKLDALIAANMSAQAKINKKHDKLLRDDIYSKTLASLFFPSNSFAKLSRLDDMIGANTKREAPGLKNISLYGDRIVSNQVWYSWHARCESEQAMKDASTILTQRLKQYRARKKSLQRDNE